MIKHAFMITSAINTKFGVFSAEERLQQTLETIHSIRARVPDVKVFLIEMSAIPLTEAQRAAFGPHVNKIVDFNDDQDVKDIFNGSENWDWVKNATEVMCFKQAVEILRDGGYFADVDRIHKISGRYWLGDGFLVTRYNFNTDKIFIKQQLPSQFPPGVTGVEKQYMSRLWSWPVALTDAVIKAYDDGFLYIAERIASGGYCDIEHMLFKFLPQEHIHETGVTGVCGNIGPNGQRVDD
jgi:hypothetical protein